VRFSPTEQRFFRIVIHALTIVIAALILRVELTFGVVLLIAVSTLSFAWLDGP